MSLVIDLIEDLVRLILTIFYFIKDMKTSIDRVRSNK